MKLDSEFRPTSWVIDNKTSVFIITLILSLFGIVAYRTLPKEQFPDIVVPTIYVSTIYPGTSPTDIENLVTKQIEKQIKGISGVKKLKSTSIQDFSNVIVEFNTDVDVPLAKQKVQDAVDRARADLPADLPRDPMVMEVNFSDLPIMYVNISGNYDLKTLKEYAEDIQDRVEGVREITRVDIVGALDREIQINVDMYKMQAANLTMGDIERAVAYENMTISGGVVKMNGTQRTVIVRGTFEDPGQIANVDVRGMSGATVKLKDIAEVKDSFKEKESYARMGRKNVITLNVIKRTGENLINASDNTRAILDEMHGTSLPKDLEIAITGDQSSATRVTLHDLINTIIIGFVLVLVILMFFMGTTNATFVALSVPLSMFLAFIVLQFIGFSLNMIVLFSFLLALGLVVDDAIVVIENTHRIFANGRVPIITAAKHAAGEVFIPVLSGTATVVAPFFPLLFWDGIIGKFMVFMPITMILTLGASLVVAYLINPVFAVQFMKRERRESGLKSITKRGFIFAAVGMGVLTLICYLAGQWGLGNFSLFMLLMIFVNKLVFTGLIRGFQEKVWPRVQNFYKRIVGWTLEGWRPWLMIGSVFFLLFFSIAITVMRQPKVVFFPSAEPNQIFTYITMPIGTDQEVTDSITKIVENRVFEVLGEENPIVESVISNVAVNAGNPMENDRSVAPYKGKVTVSFVEFAKRDGKHTAPYLAQIRDAVKDIPVAEIIVEKEQNGPPQGKPVTIEVSGGDDYEQLLITSRELKAYLDSINIAGVEELKIDLQDQKPEIIIEIDRELASRNGISTAQIGMELRNSIYGKEVSKFRDANDEHPIMLRYTPEVRNNIEDLMSLKITYRDMVMGGMLRSIPLSSIAKVKYPNAYGAIYRKNQKRVVTISSNVLEEQGYNPNEVVAKVQKAVDGFEKPDGITIDYAGQQEEQAETMAFLGKALGISFMLIFLILVLQFNSVSKPLIILSEILFSIIGVFLGLAIFNMDFSVVMTGVGIIALAGIVVKNGILLVEYADVLLKQGMDVKEAVIEAGRTRMTPVLLTATATAIGLVPLAVGMNIDFVTLFESGNPHIFFGGDSVAFWGPLSWTIIFGLTFATFITLIILPVMYLLNERFRAWRKRVFASKEEDDVDVNEAVPHTHP
jgi:multidrug efflux pump subunit AcrB